MPNPSQNSVPKKERGLGYWMAEVVEEAEVVRQGFETDPVHDLRVAIRRCRSIGEGFVPIDSHPLWKKMRKSVKPLFAALGDLRDTQVLSEWVTKLGAVEDPVRIKLLEYTESREREQKLGAERMLAAFNLKQWSEWAKVLDERSQQLPPGGDVFQIMTLQRWTHARELQATALRNRSKVSLHALRIGLKKFRYMVENFLPDLHERWQKDLKTLQDLLGEIHDLDVLWETAKQVHAFVNPDQRNQWIEIVRQERQRRLEKYRSKMLGRDSLWHEWRRALPEGEVLHRAVLKYFETWAFFRDRDISHSRRVLEASLSIYDSLIARGAIEGGQLQGVPLRDMLIVAALAHGVTTDGKPKHHKHVVRLMQRLEPPPGWSRLHMDIVSLAARYHTGALPSDSQKSFGALLAEQKSAVKLLGGILRLADSLDRSHDGAIQHLKITSQNGFMMIRAVGYSSGTRSAESIAAARHLLESEIGIPILVSGDS